MLLALCIISHAASLDIQPIISTGPIIQQRHPDEFLNNNKSNSLGHTYGEMKKERGS